MIHMTCLLEFNPSWIIHYSIDHSCILSVWHLQHKQGGVGCTNFSDSSDLTSNTGLPWASGHRPILEFQDLQSGLLIWKFSHKNKASFIFFQWKSVPLNSIKTSEQLFPHFVFVFLFVCLFVCFVVCFCFCFVLFFFNLVTISQTGNTETVARTCLFWQNYQLYD